MLGAWPPESWRNRRLGPGLLLSWGSHALLPSGLASWHQLSVFRTSFPFPAQHDPALLLGTHYLPFLCPGPGFPAPTSGPSLSQGRGHGARLVPGAGAEQQASRTDGEISTLPQFLSALSLCCPPPGPPSLPPSRRCVHVSGPQEGGTVTAQVTAPALPRGKGLLENLGSESGRGKLSRAYDSGF